MTGQIQEFCVNANARPKSKTHVFLLNIHLSLQKSTTTYVQLHQPKKVTWRGQGARVKNKFQGAGPLLAEYLRMIFKGWPHRKKVASPGQPSIDRTWWGKFKNFVSTRAQNAKHMFFCWAYICPFKRLQPHMFSFTNQKGDLKRPRRRCQK